MSNVWSDPGSFKDPDGGILYQGDRVYRFFTSASKGKFQALAESGLLDSLVSRGTVIDSLPVNEEEAWELRAAAPEGSLFVEHPRLPFVSYGYEWPFQMLKAAALTYLEVLQAAFEKGFMLKDATPFNVQFIGPKPVLIDVASFEPYQDGGPWVGYNEFCRMFLNPLLLQALTSVHFQPWLRGTLNGIYPRELSRLLSWRRKLRPDVFINVILQAWLDNRFRSSGEIGKIVSQPRVARQHLVKLMGRIKKTISGLKPGKSASSWTRYDWENTYDAEGRGAKEAFVERVLAAQAPDVVWDLGCNTGTYSFIASRHAKHVVSMDQDPDVLDILYDRASVQYPNILPLVVDVLDPSPERGWAQAERRGMLERGPADMVLALALTHHLAISGNIPLPNIMAWLARIARAGIVEYVPKNDPALQTMLRWRDDIYSSYSQPAFEAAVREQFAVIEQCEIPGSGRVLYSVVRRGDQRH